MTNEISLSDVLDRINAETGCACEVYEGITNEEVICIPADQLQTAVSVLWEGFDCNYLSTITAQQRKSHPGEIELIYHFWHGKGISLLMRLPLDAPEVASIISLLPGADFYEREVAEMYGVVFTGRAKTPKLLLPVMWDKGPPFLSREDDDE